MDLQDWKIVNNYNVKGESESELDFNKLVSTSYLQAGHFVLLE